MDWRGGVFGTILGVGFFFEFGLKSRMAFLECDAAYNIRSAMMIA